MALEWEKGALGRPPAETVPLLWLTDAVGWLPPSDTLPGINRMNGNELGPWIPGWLK